MKHAGLLKELDASSLTAAVRRMDWPLQGPWPTMKAFRHRRTLFDFDPLLMALKWPSFCGVLLLPLLSLLMAFLLFFLS